MKPESLRSWKSHPVTPRLYSYLKDRKEEAKEALFLLTSKEDFKSKDLARMHKIQGMLLVLEEFLTYSIFDFIDEGEDEDNVSDRTQDINKSR